MFNKLKSIILDDTIYIAFLLVLTAVCSFGLGKLSVMQTGNAGDNKSKVSAVQTLYNPNVGTSSLNIQPQQLLQTATHTPSVVQVIEENALAPQNFVASKSGTKYHALTCSGNKTIKETNKIYFATEEEAQAAGYTRSANCKFKTGTE